MREPQHEAGGDRSKVGAGSLPPVTAPQQVSQQHLRDAYIKLARECVREELLGRIGLFASDPTFNAMCSSLAAEAGLTTAEAVEQLWPLANAMYRAAEAVDCE